MLRKIFVLLFTALSLGSISAQTFVGRLNPAPSDYAERPFKFDTVDTLKILAVMSDFQEDKDAATFGNGKFGTMFSQTYGDTILDPLPHDREYFNEHLKFVKNYFEKVSDGKLVVEYYVLPGIITVSQRMRNYSPPSNSNDFQSLADYSKEVWTKADSANPGFNFSGYNLFTIFHAGVGRDLSLPGSIGDQKDLPSVFLSSKLLKGYYGSSFGGFPVSGGSFDIPNSLIMPETESRELSSFGGTILFEVTINGLMAASVGSYLGLPDLFDTQTGLSAIGRFGLMDPQSIFAYSGAFPPEPSAWEKIYLGWAKPVTLSPGDYNINLATKLAAASADTIILKVPISSSEYFLIENRQRDALNNGAVVTYEVNGTTHKKTFTKDSPGFYSYAVDSLAGVVTDVDEFDWALPGVVDDTADYKGGVLIWHIDDNIINAKIADNQINADPEARGVNLMEASGVPEIGVQFTTLLGDVVTGEGSYLDYWYSSNPATLYKNIFASDTRPSSDANSGAKSLITISDFSKSGDVMHFKIAYGDSLVKPVFSDYINIGSGSAYLNAVQTGSGFYIKSGSDVYLLDPNGNIKKEYTGFSSFKPASIEINGKRFVVGVKDSSINVLMTNGNTEVVNSMNTGDIITAPPVISTINDSTKILIGTASGLIKIYSLGVLPTAGPLPNVTPVLTGVNSNAENNISVKNISAHDADYAYSGSYIGPEIVYEGVTVQPDSHSAVYDENGTAAFVKSQIVGLAFTINKTGDPVYVALTSDNMFHIISKGKIISEFSAGSSDTVSSFALADLKQDGGNYIIFSAGNDIKALNFAGGSADNFPFVDPLGKGFEGTPLTADFYGDSKSDIIAATKDGRIYAVDGGTGKVIEGFPFTSGAGLKSAPVLYVRNGKLSFAALNSQNSFAGWSIGADAGSGYWTEAYGNSENTSFVPAAASENIISDFFPSKRAYNYPNPVYGNTTNIRYYVSEDSKIDIKIFDLAGGYVAHLTDNAHGGMDNETVWNVSGVQSGVYIARIEATGSSGKSESNIIKIAVIK